MAMERADIGLIGLAVMGENLAMNMESKGFCVAAYNRSREKVDRFLNGRARGRAILGCDSIAALCARLKKPRKIMLNGVAVPAFASALNYYDGYRCDHLPANLLQTQRDYFGAHSYERRDQPRGQYFHTDWTGEGGATTAETYNR